MRKKSKYKPRGVVVDVMSWLKSGMQRANQVDNGSIITQTRIKNHLAIEALRKGQASKDDMDAIITAFNVTEALCLRGIGDDYRTEITAGQQAVFDIGFRSVKHMKFIATGPELQAINLTMEIHDAQLDICTVAELEEALDYIWEQIRLKKVRRIPVPQSSEPQPT